MRTIIPFPPIHSVSGPDIKRRRTLLPFRAPGSSRAAIQDNQNLPEGETMGASIARLPRATALHHDIVDLIQAVRGRFG